MNALHSTAAALTATPKRPNENRPGAEPGGGQVPRRRHNSAPPTRRYARLAHRTATIVISSTIFGRLTLITSTRMARAPTSTAGAIGVLNAGETRASVAE